MNDLNKYIQPSIEILNIRIDEPVTSLTDLLLAAICFYAFYQIDRRLSKGSVKRSFKYYFLFLGFGALSGGLLGHAFQYRLSELWKLVSWVLTLGTVVLIAHALLVVAKPFLKQGITRLISFGNLLLFILALFFTCWSMAFAPVIYYMVFGMVVMVGSLSYFIYRKTESRGALLIMGAVGVGILSAILVSFEWGLSPWFNHNDISHVILSFVAYNIYKGAAVILDASIINV